MVYWDNSRTKCNRMESSTPQKIKKINSTKP